MSERHQTLAVLHGAIVLLVGNLFGLPLGLAVTGDAGPDAVHAWQTAHSAVTSGGVMMIAIGAASRYLTLGPGTAAWLVWSLVAMGYGAIVVLGLGAAFGVRGFAPTGPPLNLVAFLGNLAVVGGSLLGVAIVIQGATASLRRA